MNRRRISSHLNCNTCYYTCYVVLRRIIRTYALLRQDLYQTINKNYYEGNICCSTNQVVASLAFKHEPYNIVILFAIKKRPMPSCGLMW